MTNIEVSLQVARRVWLHYAEDKSEFPQLYKIPEGREMPLKRGMGSLLRKGSKWFIVVPDEKCVEWVKLALCIR